MKPQQFPADQAEHGLSRQDILKYRPDWLKVSEVARFAWIKKLRVYQAIQAGALKAQKSPDGRGYRVMYRDAIAWVEANLPVTAMEKDQASGR